MPFVLSLSKDVHRQAQDERLFDLVTPPLNDQVGGDLALCNRCSTPLYLVPFDIDPVRRALN